MSVMLYKHPGKHKLHGDKFDYIVVDELEVDKALSDGWYKTTPEALKNSKVIEAKVVKKSNKNGYQDKSSRKNTHR